MTHEQIDAAEDYIKNVMTKKDLDAIDTTTEEYQKFYRERRIDIRRHLLFPITNEELESRIKTQFHLKNMGYFF